MNPSFREAAKVLEESLKSGTQEKVAEDILAESVAQYQSLVHGLSEYAEHPHKQWQSSSKTIWQRGNARLLDFSEENQDYKTTLLITPSLINRWNIVDLQENLSFISYLKSSGIHPLVLDWGDPGELEKKLDTAGYIEEILLPAIRFTKAQFSENKLFLLGYCMGGSFAVAASQLAPELVDGLILFAAPWNFHSEDFKQIPLSEENMDFVRSSILAADIFPAQMVQYMFYMQDPFLFHKKFMRFGSGRVDESEKDVFVAVEEWANNGVDLSSHVAAECMIDWAQKNTLMNGEWEVMGQKILPELVKVPTFVSIPKRDRIVPPLCAMPLAQKIPGAHLHQPDSGHVGLTASPKAEEISWKPLKDWINLINKH